MPRYSTRSTTSVSSSKCAVPAWKSLTAARIASTVACAELQAEGCSRSTAVKPLGAEHLALGVLRVDDAVGEEDDHVAGLGRERELVVLRVGKQAEREAFGLDGADGEARRQHQCGQSAAPVRLNACLSLQAAS